jgi:hypothetical protein
MQRDGMCGRGARAAACVFEMSPQWPATVLPDPGRLFEVAREIDSSGKHSDAALGCREKRRLRPGKAHARVCAEDKCGTVEPSPGVVISRGRAVAHEQVCETVVFDRKVHANLLTAK